MAEVQWKAVIKDLKKVIEKQKEMYDLSHPSGEEPTYIEITNPNDESIQRVLTRQQEINNLSNNPRTEIDSEVYWEGRLQAKIELISAAFGFEAMQEIYRVLQEDEKNHIYNYSGNFSSNADGIGGWWM